MMYESQILAHGDDRGQAVRRALLAEANLRPDPFEEWALILFEDGRPVATGAFYHGTLRALAVIPDRQGEGLMALLVTALETEAARRGCDRLFIVAQPKDRRRFAEVGYTSLTPDAPRLHLLENSAVRFEAYTDRLAAGLCGEAERTAAIVMHANPFTLGHLRLIETALDDRDEVAVFILSDDKPGGLPAADRMALARQATASLAGVRLFFTGPYAVSHTTFPSYFYPGPPDAYQDTRVRDEAELDAALFAEIARKAAIGCRYVGTEPHSAVTARYNETLREVLEPRGVAFRVCPRFETEGQIISASLVRRLWRQGAFDALRPLVPDATFRYLRERTPSSDGRGSLTSH